MPMQNTKMETPPYALLKFFHGGLLFCVPILRTTYDAATWF